MTFPDPLFQQIVLQQGMLTTDLVLQLQTRQRELAATGEARPLIEIAVSMGFMAPAWNAVMAIAQNQGWSPPDGVPPPYPWALYKPEVPVAAPPVTPQPTSPPGGPAQAAGSTGPAPAAGPSPGGALAHGASAAAPPPVAPPPASSPGGAPAASAASPPQPPTTPPAPLQPTGTAPPPPAPLPLPAPLPQLAQGPGTTSAPPTSHAPTPQAPTAGAVGPAPTPAAAAGPPAPPLPASASPPPTSPQAPPGAGAAPGRTGSGARKRPSGTGRLGSGALRRRTRTFAAPSDLGGSASGSSAGYLALAVGGALAVSVAVLGVAFLLRGPQEQVAQTAGTPTPAAAASAQPSEGERWQELAREEIRRAREELGQGDVAGGRQRLQRCMALLKEKPNSKAARLALFEALERFPAVETQAAPKPRETPASLSEFTSAPPREEPRDPAPSEVEEDPLAEENPLALDPEEDLPPSISEPDPLQESPAPSAPSRVVDDPEPEVSEAQGDFEAARLWLLAAAAFDRSDRLGLQKLVASIVKASPKSVYVPAGKGLLAFLHDDFAASRRALEPLHTDPKLRAATKAAGLLRPEMVLVRVAFYTKRYDLARSVADQLRDPSERRIWRLLVDGPFAEEFPHLYPALTTLSPDERYRVISDVGITGSELDRLESEMAAAGSPGKLDAMQRKVRKSHKLLGTISEVLDKAALAYGKLLSQKAGKDVFPTVYVFKDRAGFAKFGRGIGIGSTENALGYYMPDYRVLVFYEETEDVKLGLSRNTVETLLHETFHQWIHLHLEDAPPWFNEGMAEYFSLGAKIGRKSLEYAVLPQRNPSRLTNIRDALRGEFAKPWSLRSLMRADQRTFMTPGQSGVNYAHAWSLVHYLGATPKRRRLLRSYFQALLSGLDSNAAYAKVFGKLDMNAMEADWKDYILTVK